MQNSFFQNGVDGDVIRTIIVRHETADSGRCVFVSEVKTNDGTPLYLLCESERGNRKAEVGLTELEFIALRTVIQ